MRVFNDAVENQDVISVSILLVLRALSQQQQKKPTLKDQGISKILLNKYFNCLHERHIANNKQLVQRMSNQRSAIFTGVFL